MSLCASTNDVVLRQSDESQFGRGEQHLSALVEEGDVIVYQTGWWWVDGVVVGDPDVDYDESQPPTVSYCQVDTIQVVWTHNCEHGLLRGRALTPRNQKELVFIEPIEEVQLGPEQLLAKLPVEWKETDETKATSSKIAVAPLVLQDSEWLEQEISGE